MEDPLLAGNGARNVEVIAGPAGGFVDCSELLPENAETSVSADAASLPLRELCCVASWGEHGFVLADAERGQGDAGGAPAATNPSTGQPILGFAPVDPDLQVELCGGGSREASSSDILIGFVQGDTPGVGGSFGGDASSVGGVAGGGNGGGGVSVTGLGDRDVSVGDVPPLSRAPVGFAPEVIVPSVREGGPARVPEIDAVSGIVALAVLTALVAFRRERR